MRSNKFYRILPFGFVFILLLTFSDAVIAQKRNQQPPRPIIPVAKIYSDIVGKRVVGILPETPGIRSIGWTFEENEPREIAVLGSRLIGNVAYVTVNMLTEGIISSDGLMGKVSGNLGLRYEATNGGWLLTEVQNLTLKYASYNSRRTVTSQYENNVSAPSISPLVSGAFTINAGYSKSFRFVVSNRANVSGRFRVSDGRYDVEVFILDQDGYENFTNGHTTSTFYNSGRRTVGTVGTNLSAGVYYIVFNNGYSILTPKAVEASISIQNQ